MHISMTLRYIASANALISFNLRTSVTPVFIFIQDFPLVQVVIYAYLFMRTSYKRIF